MCQALGILQEEDRSSLAFPWWNMQSRGEADIKHAAETNRTVFSVVAGGSWRCENTWQRDGGL